jgi:Dolichyl-phosphate-mannose-protein mannosyltransferase
MPQPETSTQHGQLGEAASGRPAVSSAADSAPASTAATGSAPTARAAASSAPTVRAAAGSAPATTAPGAAGPGGPEPAAQLHGPRRRMVAAWPLLAVLVVQAVLSARLLRADTAFQDEALYLWAGHLQWSHWLHGTSIPPFPYYFSGAPVIYPPLGALADSIGGLAAARALSLVFMLGSTALLWGTAGRLFGRRAAFFAAALFAVLGPTLHLGAFATYDAMALFLIALAAWCVVRAGERGEAVGWMIAAGAAMALANAAAYSSVLFDVFVIALAVLVVWPGAGGRVAARRAATVLIVTAALLTAGLLVGGGNYLSGFERTTLARVPGSESPLSVLADSWSWAGLIFALAICGVITSWAGRGGRARTLLLAVLALAVVAGPLEQARLHTAASLNKHVGLGAWFAAIAAGYALDRFIAAAPAGRAQTLTTGACVVALTFPAVLGASQSWQFSTSWPNATTFIAVFRPLANRTTGPMLVEDPSIAEYYLHASNWRRWSSTRNIVLPSGASTGHPTSQGIVGAGNPASFARYIAEGYFSLVALNFADTTPLDHAIAADLRRHHYKPVQVVPYGIEVPPIGQGTYVIYRYEPSR